RRMTSHKNRRLSWATGILAILALVPSLYGFGTKFLEFIALTRGDIEGVFALSPVCNYLLASLGFMCLMVWAALNGMFHDIERPKRTMLETEEWLDRTEIAQHPRVNGQVQAISLPVRMQTPKGRV
ncbi:MAG TPA: hypothetical protein VHB77_18665, partial [Planctomycetaceae bacterium]|nr:hypothetical protein [Planctomycetaceae bacterium]